MTICRSLKSQNLDNHALNRFLLRCVVIWVNRVRYGLKIVGKENFRKTRLC